MSTIITIVMSTIIIIIVMSTICPNMSEKFKLLEGCNLGLVKEWAA